MATVFTRFFGKKKKLKRVLVACLYKTEIEFLSMHFFRGPYNAAVLFPDHEVKLDPPPLKGTANLCVETSVKYISSIHIN